MHYFPSWTEEAVMNMSYDKFTMYLATIPDYTAKKEGDEAAAAPTKKKAVKRGSFNLFDLDQRHKN